MRDLNVPSMIEHNSDPVVKARWDGGPKPRYPKETTNSMFAALTEMAMLDL